MSSRMMGKVKWPIALLPRCAAFDAVEGVWRTGMAEAVPKAVVILPSSGGIICVPMYGGLVDGAAR